MANTSTSDSVADLKHLLITGHESPVWNGYKIVPPLVNWYLKTEWQQHNNPQEGNEPREEQLVRPRSANPCDSLIKSVNIIPKLISEGRGKEAIEILRHYNKIVCVDKETVVLCLTLAAKKHDERDVVDLAYTAVREICNTSYLFFLFIQLSKMISKKSGHTGWGRRLRRTVAEWYMGWEPEKLALEVTRHSKELGWSHRDVIHLAHIKMKNLPLGTQVVVSYIFKGLEETKKKYGPKDNTRVILELLETLNMKSLMNKDKKTEVDVDRVITKIDKLHKLCNKYGALTLNDVPSQSLKNAQVWSNLLTKLEGGAVLASINRLYYNKMLTSSNDDGILFISQLINLLNSDSTADKVTPASVLLALHSYETPIKPIAPPVEKKDEVKQKEVKDPQKPQTKRTNGKIIEALRNLISNSAKKSEYLEEGLLICIDVKEAMGNVWTGNPQGKGEVSARDAIGITVMTLSSGGSNESVKMVAFTKSGLSDVNVTVASNLLQLTKTFDNVMSEKGHGDVSIKSALDRALATTCRTVVVLTCNVNQDQVNAAGKEVKDFNVCHNKNIRLVYCGLSSKHLSAERSHNTLVMLGFNSQFPSIIQSLHKGLL